MSYLNGLQVIALSDHNTCKNVPAILEAAKQYENLMVIPAMELTTAEEIHVLCLFAQLSQAMDFDAYVEQKLFPIDNRPEIFGNQTILDSQDNPIGEFPYLLINATSISMEEVYPLVQSYGGWQSRPILTSRLTVTFPNTVFLPQDAPFPCYELADLSRFPDLAKQNPVLQGKNLISDSDAHYLHQMREQTHFLELDVPPDQLTPGFILDHLKSL